MPSLWQWVLEGDRFLMSIFIPCSRFGGTTLQRWCGVRLEPRGRRERRAQWGAGGVAGRGGVKGSAGGGRILGAGRVYKAPAQGA